MSAPAYRALRIRTEGSPRCEMTKVSIANLSDGDVVVAVEFSAINYKDALAATGSAPILRAPALIGGIDAAGRVAESANENFSIGDAVVGSGCGMSESRDGGFSERLRLPGDYLIKIPDPHTSRTAAILGTAGLTAMLAIERLQENGISPQAGPILVTGASGGVGSLAVLLLGKLGYQAIAMTAKAEAHELLRALGAVEIRDPNDLPDDAAGLARAEIAGAIDNLGGAALPALARMTAPWGCVVSIGVAAGTDFEGSVMPFIIRGVSILGITSANCPIERRRRAWGRLFEVLHPDDLEPLVADTVELEALPERFAGFLQGQGRGRTLVRLNQS